MSIISATIVYVYKHNPNTVIKKVWPQSIRLRAEIIRDLLKSVTWSASRHSFVIVVFGTVSPISTTCMHRVYITRLSINAVNQWVDIEDEYSNKISKRYVLSRRQRAYYYHWFNQIKEVHKFYLGPILYHSYFVPQLSPLKWVVSPLKNSRTAKHLEQRI